MKYYLLTLSFFTISFFSIGQVGKQHFYDLTEEQVNYYIDSLNQLEFDNETDRITNEVDKSLIYSYYNDYQKAIVIMNDLILFHPKDYKLYHQRGNYHIESNHHQKAIRDFSTALIYAPDSAYVEILVNRAAAFSHIRQFDKAYNDLQKAYAKDSTDLGVLNNLGTVSDELGRKEESFIYFNKIIELDPTFMPGYLNLGFKYQLIGEHEMAIEQFNIVIENSQYLGLSLNNRAYSRLQLGDVKGAYEDVMKSLYVDDTNSYAFRNLALIYIEMKDYEKACEAIDESINKGFIPRYGNEIVDLKNKYCEISSTQ
ncbi:hypothetical protein KMW28_07665 [Flammeovirga yaeyamensis]|uniref:Tetratricopeptide repeat protein n=1 Tax=Flammeovirga yaeyamensis TaxID=367791 RepID=A0AAX1NBQ4_9BACT|nr:tetratricopeptide repeat protein [Flammeovirga yaeyamensis]MBB3698059.1 tetratricopeptide (TPR) repeat protein [Flammeovirga yaeyamensis]NMF35589.1 hypothetical protein [Flammeovirga yaeyamensis]QWG03453.1 hypothetical protein KMW28_07665 [Flammeovirga yaeyamensis]